MKEEEKLFIDLNNNTNNNLLETYLNIQKFYEDKFGHNTVVLIEIGSFFEIYQNQEIGKAKEIADVLNIQLTRKNKNIQEITNKNPYMAGIPSVSIDKYLNILMKTNNWNVVIINQEKKGKIVTRYLNKVLSPGTNIDFLNDSIENYITSLYIEKNYQGIYIVGISATDVSTGKTIVKEIIGDLDDKNNALDEINIFLASHNSKELLIEFNNVSGEEYDDIMKNIKKYTVPHFIKKSRKDSKISYQNTLLKNIFNLKSFLSPIEELNLERNIYSLKALINIIEFIIEHDNKLANRLSKPEIILKSKYLELGNNALEQLDIVSKKDKSVFDIIDFTTTTIGKRLLKERITKPILSKKELDKRYEATEYISNHFEIYNYLTKELKNVYDIERLKRRIEIQNIHPYELSYFYNSLVSMTVLLKVLEDEEPQLLNILNHTHSTDINQILNIIEDNFDINELSKYNILSINGNFLNTDKHREISDLINETNQFDEKLEDEVYKLIKKESRFRGNEIGTEVIESVRKEMKIKYTDLEGFYLEISKNRFNKYFKNLSEKYDVKKLTNVMKISGGNIRKISDKKVLIQNKINNLNKKVYSEFLENIDENFFLNVEKIIYQIAELDVYCSSAYLIKFKKYSLPNIIDSDNESFLEAEGLRHVIIENIEENGIYIPNDIVLGNKKYSTMKDSFIFDKNDIVKGGLLYGINSSGKSSLNKSIGIATILAQSGIPVPASEFNYSIFENLYTRISGHDNIHRGLSTFAIEMIELKNILNRCNNKSLILGDEISHGTETTSGLSIVAAAIKLLSEKNNIFIFSTHLHQLENIDVVKKLNNIIHFHLSVSYNEDKETLTYGRKLKPGSGSSIYGLEFAKSLKMNEEFLNMADKIRREIAEELESRELIVEKKFSKYNTDVIIEKCSICDNKADDTHHIKEQQEADGEGNIEHFHKNHRYNLVTLCKKHHKEVHNERIVINGYIKTNEGLVLDWEESK